MAPPDSNQAPTVLFDPARHEPLSGQAWDPDRAQAAIDGIVSDMLAHGSTKQGWPPHPQDSAQQAPLTALYHGNAGVLWALNYLTRNGACEPLPPGLFTLETIERAHQRNHTWLQAETSDGYDSYFLGDLPLLLMARDLQASDHSAEGLRTVLGREHDPTLEILWGRPGWMLAAVLLHEHDGDLQWADLFRLQTRRLWDSLDPDPDTGIRLWQQDLYGERSRLVGAMHGFAGNVFAVIKGLHLLTPAEQAEWADLVVATTHATARTMDGLPNWPQSLGTPRQGRDGWLLQHCHGAPGMINSLAELADPRLDDLLAAAGETVWQAGPLRKGANLCHGTGGNGYAFLKLYRRTGNPLWLERARAFAMHGIGQTESARHTHGHGRYSLWTGDAGFAIYLWDSLRGEAAIPTWDVFF